MFVYTDSVVFENTHPHTRRICRKNDYSSLQMKLIDFKNFCIVVVFSEEIPIWHLETELLSIARTFPMILK